MKRLFLLTSLLVAELPAPIPEERPAAKRPAQEAGSPAARTPTEEAVEEQTSEAPVRQPARSLNKGRAGDASGYQGQQQPVTGPGVDPDTGKAPERKVDGYRFGTSVDDSQRLGPRAR